MKILLHICCAPCTVFPLEELRREGAEVTGYFFNHNIHPYQEYVRRRDAVRQFSGEQGLEVVWRDEYLLEDFLAAVASEPGKRCGYCYLSRMEDAAKTAAALGYPAFSTTLLYSRYQNHDLIREAGERLAAANGISFHYDDWRRGWRRGIDESKRMGMYRQQYCGCIYSEKERYWR
jgi:epoxyqueuosine reductase